MTFKEAYKKANDQLHAPRQLLETVRRPQKRRPIRVYVPATVLAAFILVFGVRQVMLFQSRTFTKEELTQSEQPPAIKTKPYAVAGSAKDMDDTYTNEKRAFSDGAVFYDEAVSLDEEDAQVAFYARAATADEAAKETGEINEVENGLLADSGQMAEDRDKERNVKTATQKSDISPPEKTEQTTLEEDEKKGIATVPASMRKQDPSAEAAPEETAATADLAAGTAGGRFGGSSSAGTDNRIQSSSVMTSSLQKSAPLQEFLAIGGLTKAAFAIEGLKLSVEEQVAYQDSPGGRRYEDVLMHLDGEGRSALLLLSLRSGTPYGPEGVPADGVYAGFSCGGLYITLEAYGLTKAEVFTIIQTICQSVNQ